jgi:hypothetical protein
VSDVATERNTDSLKEHHTPTLDSMDGSSWHPGDSSGAAITNILTHEAACQDAFTAYSIWSRPSSVIKFEVFVMCRFNNSEEFRKKAVY